MQMNLPKGWIPRTDIEDTGFEAPVKDQVKDSTLAPNVILKAAEINGIKPADVDEILKTKRKQYAQIFKGFKEVDPTPPAKMVPGKGVGAIEFTYTPKEGITLRGRQIWIVGDGKVYFVTWTSLNDTYPKNQKAFDAAMNTLVVP